MRRPSEMLSSSSTIRMRFLPFGWSTAAYLVPAPGCNKGSAGAKIAARTFSAGSSGRADGRMRPRMSAQPQPFPRTSLAATCVGHAAIFGWAAASLPWRSGTLFALILSVLALLHAATAVIALLRRPLWLLWIWRALTIASAFAFVVVGWSMAAAAL